MGSKIVDLLTNLELNNEDFQRSYNYEVFCPRFFFKLNDKKYNLNKFIHEVTIPTRNIDMESEHTSNYVVALQPYSDIMITFKETSDMAVKNCIEFWQGQMVSVNDYIYPPFIARENMFIRTTDMEGNVKSTTLAVDVVPVKLDPPKFGDGQNEVMLQTVTFKLRKAINKELQSVLNTGSVASAVTTGSNLLNLA